MVAPTLARLIAKLFARPQSRRDRRRAARLGLEALEGRDVPAVTFTVDALSNAAEGGGAGEFRVTANGDSSDFTNTVCALVRAWAAPPRTRPTTRPVRRTTVT